jgi:RNA polymerase II subunit A small phosphatase-like protein
MDPAGTISQRLFRDACTNFNGAFVKDMRAMGRSLNEIIIVDNSPICYCLQPENAVPIKSWFDDQSDTEL